MIFDSTGVGTGRVALEFCSAAEGAKFADFARRLTDEVKKTGKNPIFAK